MKLMDRARRLLKSVTAAVEPTAEELENAPEEESAGSEVRKAFDAAAAELQSEIGGDAEENEDEVAEEPIVKAKGKKAPPVEEESEEEDEEEEGEEDESKPFKGKKAPPFMKKSVEAAVSEDPESEAAMDVEPFLKSLVKGIDRRIDDQATQIRDIAETNEAMYSVLKVLAKAVLMSGEITKSVHESLEAIGSVPEPRKGQLTLMDRFQKSGADATDYDPRVARATLTELAKSKKLDSRQVGVVEMRLNHGQELPDFFIPFMEKKSE